MSTVHKTRNPVIKNESCMCMIEDVVSFSFSSPKLLSWPYLCGGDKDKLTKEKKNYGNLNNSSITCISNVNFLILKKAGMSWVYFLCI